MLLGAGRASRQVLAHPRDVRVGMLTGQLTVDIDVEQVKTFLASAPPPGLLTCRTANRWVIGPIASPCPWQQPLAAPNVKEGPQK